MIKLKEKAVAIYSHEGFRKYFFNTGWMFVEKFLRLVSGLFIGAYVARYLGPSQYGLLNYAISLVSLFSALSNLGLDEIVVRELVRDESKRNVLLGTAATLKFFGSMLVLAGLVITVNFSGTDSATAWVIYIVGFGAVCEVFGVVDFFFQSRVWSKYVVWSQITALLTTSTLRIIFALLKKPLIWFAWVYTADLLLLAVGLIFFYSNNGFNPLAWRFDWSWAKKLLKNSWPLILSVLAVTIYMKIDQIMVKWMLGDAANGNYSVAVRLSEMWNFFPIAICASLFPAILNAKKASEELYLKRLQWLYDLMVGLAVIIAIPMTFLSGIVIRILFGEAYAESGAVLAVYIWSGVFTFLGVANGKWMITENLQVFRMTSLVLAGILNIVLNYFFAMYFGLIGPAISTLISYGVAAYFSFFLFFKNPKHVLFHDKVTEFV